MFKRTIESMISYQCNFRVFTGMFTTLNQFRARACILGFGPSSGRVVQ